MHEKQSTRQRSQKGVLGIEKDDIGNLEDLPSVVVIDDE